MDWVDGVLSSRSSKRWRLRLAVRANEDRLWADSRTLDSFKSRLRLAFPAVTLLEGMAELVRCLFSTLAPELELLRVVAVRGAA